MAQYFFAAADYPVGTKLQDLGFVPKSPDNIIYFEVALDGSSRKYWNQVGTDDYRTAWVFEEAGAVAAQEVFMAGYDGQAANSGRYAILRCNADGQQRYSHGAAATLHYMQKRSAWSDQATLKSGFGDSSFATAGPMAIRVGVTAAHLHYVKAWACTNANFAANEPGTNLDTYTDSTYATGFPGIEVGSSVFKLAVIGIGTNGDPAPTSMVIPPASVAVPTGLNETSITATGATLNWTAG